ncbi:hypothetical protein IJ182_07775 [bacterium]|nr:hypothetical protein [bacterium]
MITPISFGSTYKVASGSTFPLKQQLSYDELKRYCDNKWYTYNEKTTYNLKQQYGVSTYKVDSTIVIPDKEDIALETFCANKGISFNKFERSQIMKPEQISSRIQPAPFGYKKAIIDADKLTDALATVQNIDYKTTQKRYETKGKKENDYMLNSADPIPASTLKIIKPEDNKDSVKIEFVQQTEAPDDCMYFAMKDAGMKDIPVYMDNNSYKIANKLGILKN